MQSIWVRMFECRNAHCERIVCGVCARATKHEVRSGSTDIIFLFEPDNLILCIKLAYTHWIQQIYCQYPWLICCSRDSIMSYLQYGFQFDAHAMQAKHKRSMKSVISIECSIYDVTDIMKHTAVLTPITTLFVSRHSDQPNPPCLRNLRSINYYWIIDWNLECEFL